MTVPIQPRASSPAINRAATPAGRSSVRRRARHQRARPDDNICRSCVALAHTRSHRVAHIARVFSDHRIAAEALEISHGEQTIIRYKAVLNGDRQLELVSQQLLENGSNGIKSVSWEAPKRWI